MSAPLDPKSLKGVALARELTVVLTELRLAVEMRKAAARAA